MIWRKLGDGVVAGAAGVTALNVGYGAATYATLTALENHA